MRDMIRANTPAEINKAIDESTLELLEKFEDASADEIHEHLELLDEEWDVECFVELFGGAAALAGIALAARWRRLAFVPAIAAGLVVAHSLPFWDPLTPLIRLFGVRSRTEIEREKFALKMLRGDFERLQKDRSPKSALATAPGEVGLKEGGPMSNEPPRRKGIPRGAEETPTRH